MQRKEHVKNIPKEQILKDQLKFSYYLNLHKDMEKLSHDLILI